MGKAKPLGYMEFMMRVGLKVYTAAPGPGQRMAPPRLDEDIQVYVPEFRVLVAAAHENCPSAFSQFLQQWLRRLGVEPPPNVFRPIRYGKPGRPEGSSPEGINASSVYILWDLIGQPSLTSTKLAKEYYKDAYKAAKVDERKKMVDRLRRAVQRVQEQVVTYD